MSWLSGYTYRKEGAVNATAAGAQTLYQLKLVVGESSGASGADVHCENHCLDFPNDVRFTKEDGETKHDYWVEEITGTTPNRKATVWIEVISIPASSSVDFYMYYRKASDSGESNGGNSFPELFDHFDGDSFDTNKWVVYAGSTPSVANSIVTLDSATQKVHSINTWNGYSSSIVLEAKVKHYSARMVGLSKTSAGEVDYSYYIALNNAVDRFVAEHNNDGWQGSVGLTENTWGMFKAIWTSSDIYGYEDSTLLGHKTSNITNCSAWIYFYIYSADYNSAIYVDWILVRKYASPEPTWGSWGGEGSAGISLAGTIAASTTVAGTLPCTKPIVGSIDAVSTVQGELKCGQPLAGSIGAVSNVTGVISISEILRPNAVGDLTQITYQYPASGAHWDKVDEATPDDDTTYVYIDETASVLTDIYNLPPHSGLGTINSVRIHVRAKRESSAGGNLRIMHKTHGVLYQSSAAGLDTYYVSFYTTLTTNPNTGLAWTWAEIDALQIGAKIWDANEAYKVSVTQVYAEIDYKADELLAGTIDSISTVAGALVNAYPLAGGITAESTIQGQLSRTRNVAGSIGAVSSVTGGTIVSWTLAGTMVASSTVSSSLSKGIPIAGIIEATTGVTGTIECALPLAGEIAAISTIQGLLRMGLQGSIETISSVTGKVGILRGLSGGIPIESLISGSVTRIRSISGLIAAEAAITSALTKYKSLKSIVNASSNVQGRLKYERPLEGSVDAVSSIVGNLTGLWALIGQSQANSSVTSSLRLDWSLANAIATTTTVSGTLTKRKQLVGAISASSTVQGQGGVVWHIAGVIAVVSRVSHKVSVVIRGFYYSKLGTENLINPPDTDFNITEELNGIASFDFVVQNNAANRTIITDHLTEDYKIMRDDGTVILIGSIDSDSIEYFAEGEGGGGKRIRLSGYASFVDLAYLIYKRMGNADAENVGSVQDEDNSTSTFTDYTSQANTPAINDVLPTFGAVDDALYVGKDETFFSVKTQYSTKGIQAANTTVVIEYSKGSGVWATFDCIDESYAFTEPAGTHLLYTGNKPDDWAKDTVNGKNQYHLRFRITQGSYTTQKPKLDRIWLSNADVCRVQFNEVSAKTIMGYVLAGTGYSEDATDQCPTNAITIRGEYDSRLRWAFGIGSALTWEDGNGDKQRYDVWVDTSKKVHYKQQRGTDKGNLSGYFRAVNNKMGYHGIGTRIFGAGSYEGINQKRAIVEDTTAQATHKLREIVLEDNRITGYDALKEETQKSLTTHKAPLKEVSGDIDTQYWLDHSLAVGDKITINQPDWNLNNQELYIMRASIDPSNTHLDLGTSQMHLEHMRSSLQRQMDVNNVWMHGSVSTYVIGPEEENYDRVDNETAHPVRMTIDVPSNARAINHVEISWTLMDYQSSVTGSGSGGGHSHGAGPVGREGAHLHGSGPSGYEGGHDHATGDEGGHEHTISIEGVHWHTVSGSITWTEAAAVVWVYATGDEGGHSHTNSSTGYEATHEHGVSGSTGSDDGGGPHTHPISLDSGGGGGHSHTQGNTGYEADHFHSISMTGSYFVKTIDNVTAWTSSLHEGHSHPESSEPDHSHGVTFEVNHRHTVPDTSTEPDHEHTGSELSTEPGHDHTLTYGIHEEAGGTTLELYVGDELVGANYVGEQSAINITGWITTGSNQITLKPIIGDNVKGRAKLSAIATVFLENLK